MSVVTTLRQADVFYEFTLTQLELIASICTEMTYSAGEMIFEENSTGSELYIIANGEINIQVNPALVGKEGEHMPFTIARLLRGQSFGEVALIDEGVRSARAVAAEDETRLLVIPRDKLMLMCNAYPQLGYRFMRNIAADLAMKIRSTDLQVREYVTWMRRDRS